MKLGKKWRCKLGIHHLFLVSQSRRFTYWGCVDCPHVKKTRR